MLVEYRILCRRVVGKLRARWWWEKRIGHGGATSESVAQLGSFLDHMYVSWWSWSGRYEWLRLRYESKKENKTIIEIRIKIWTRKSLWNLLKFDGLLFSSDPFFISQNGTFESHEKKLILNQGKRKTGKSPILEIRQNKGLGWAQLVSSSRMHFSVFVLRHFWHFLQFETTTTPPIWKISRIRLLITRILVIQRRMHSFDPSQMYVQGLERRLESSLYWPQSKTPQVRIERGCQHMNSTTSFRIASQDECTFQNVYILIMVDFRKVWDIISILQLLYPSIWV